MTLHIFSLFCFVVYHLLFHTVLFTFLDYINEIPPEKWNKWYTITASGPWQASSSCHWARQSYAGNLNWMWGEHWSLHSYSNKPLSKLGSYLHRESNFSSVFNTVHNSNPLHFLLSLINPRQPGMYFVWWVDELQYDEFLRLAKNIATDPSHVLSEDYQLLPSGRHFRVPSCKRNTYKHSFLPQSFYFAKGNLPKLAVWSIIIKEVVDLYFTSLNCLVFDACFFMYVCLAWLPERWSKTIFCANRQRKYPIVVHLSCQLAKPHSN